MRSRLPLRISSLLALALATATLGCSWVIGDTPMSTVHPATEAGRMIQEVYAPLTWWVIGIFVAVEGFLLYVVLRFRRRSAPDGEVPTQAHGNTPLEIGWTLLPVIPIVAVMVPSLQATCALQEPAPEEALDVVVTGKRWWFEFEYPEYGIVTANELHLPVGRMANLRLESDNVIHSFWVPRLSGKRDMVPGRGQNVWFTPEETGWFEGQCAELCGASHGKMKIRVKVETPEAFQAWVERMQTPQDVDMTSPGIQAFQQNACFTCHAIDGSPWTFARTGPDLTHVGSRTTIAGASLENNFDNLVAWIRNAGQFKPGHAVKERQAPDLMWNFEHVPDEQVEAMARMLQGFE